MPTPPVSGVLAWYAADQITSPPSSGSALSSWNDLSGNGYTASQGTSADQPTYNTGVLNGLPGVQFNGSSDYMEATLGGALTQPFTVFAVTKTSSSGGAYTGVILSSGLNQAWIGGGSLSLINTGSFLTGATSTAAKYSTFLVNGASSVIRDNGSQTASGSAGTNNFNAALYIGANGYNGLYEWNGYIYELLIYASALNTTQMQTVESYLDNKWFVAPSTPSPLPVINWPQAMWRSAYR